MRNPLLDPPVSANFCRCSWRCVAMMAVHCRGAMVVVRGCGGV